MAPQMSEMKCRCGRNAMEWVSFIQKNSGRRFVRCANRVTPCRFWKWIDDPVSPLVPSAMDLNVKKSQRIVKFLGLVMAASLVVIFVFLRMCLRPL
ncbi:hypothetical protein LIER_11042 [Lithospermum erythrorhizon]|uniref:GRF-type domain-containing protein n=1 Tax=Lithospermum erythrorhizon TaxID=34254 RepID=A0AAV3PMU2_LITER